MTKIPVTHFQLKALLEIAESSGDPESYDDLYLIVVADNSAHSGPGLYALFQEVPEEGFMFIGEDQEAQDRGEKICEDKIASGEVTEL